MQGKHFVADARDGAAVQAVSRALSAWDPLLSLKVTRGDSLYGGIFVCYGVNIGGSTTLSFHDRREPLEQGDAIVLPPSLRVAAHPPAEILWLCYEGLAPDHLRGPQALSVGFERFASAVGDAGSREVLPAGDLRFRTHYTREQPGDGPRQVQRDVAEICYVLDGTGTIRVYESSGSAAEVPIQAGQMLVAGADVIYQVAGPLELGTWRWCKEMEYRRRLRESAGS